MMRLDGGLATALQGVGLPPMTPVEPWLTAHPDRVRAAHTAFADAGASILLTATFLAAASPDTLVDTVHRAVVAAQRLGPAVWGCSGPVAQDPATYGVLARRLAAEDVHTLVLETFTRSDDALTALQHARSAAHVIVSLVPNDALMLADGTPLRDAADHLMRAGALGVGVNCIPVERTLRAVTALDGHPIWAKPSGEPDWSEQAAVLRPHVRWLGGCCGVSPNDLAALWAAV